MDNDQHRQYLHEIDWLHRKIFAMERDGKNHKNKFVNTGIRLDI